MGNQSQYSNISPSTSPLSSSLRSRLVNLQFELSDVSNESVRRTARLDFVFHEIPRRLVDGTIIVAYANSTYADSKLNSNISQRGSIRADVGLSGWIVEPLMGDSDHSVHSVNYRNQTHMGEVPLPPHKENTRSRVSLVWRCNFPARMSNWVFNSMNSKGAKILKRMQKIWSTNLKQKSINELQGDL